MFSQKTIKGTVTDQSLLPLPGATILIEGSDQGTVTDFDGNFEINASEGDLLQFSYLGFKTQVVPVSSSILNIIMEIQRILYIMLHINLLSYFLKILLNINLLILDHIKILLEKVNHICFIRFYHLQ